MKKATQESKVILTTTVEPSTFRMLKEHKEKHGISASWIVNTLLSNYLASWQKSGV